METSPATLDFNQSIQRCAAAYHRVRAELPSDPYYHADLRNQHKAFLAFAAELPLLIDPPSFQLYIACIGQGAAIGAIDPVDVGRLCHIANTAMSAWKLANLIAPAAQATERAARQAPLPAEGNQSEEKAVPSQPQQPHRGEETATPLPPKGNQPEAQCRQAGSESRPQQPSKGEEKSAPLPPKGNQAKDEALPYDDWENLYAATKLPTWETQVKLFNSLRERGINIPTDEELRKLPAQALRHCETARYFQSAAQPQSPQPAKEQPPASKEPPAQAA